MAQNKHIDPTFIELSNPYGNSHCVLQPVRSHGMQQGLRMNSRQCSAQQLDITKRWFYMLKRHESASLMREFDMRLSLLMHIRTCGGKCVPGARAPRGGWGGGVGWGLRRIICGCGAKAVAGAGGRTPGCDRHSPAVPSSTARQRWDRSQWRPAPRPAPQACRAPCVDAH